MIEYAPAGQWMHEQIEPSPESRWYLTKCLACLLPTAYCFSAGQILFSVYFLDDAIVKIGTALPLVAGYYGELRSQI